MDRSRLWLGLTAAAAAPEIGKPMDLLHIVPFPSLEVAPCATSSAPVSFNESGSGRLVSVGWPDQCVTARCRLRAGSGAGPVTMADCGAAPACQAWAFQPNGTVTLGGLCLQSAPTSTRLELSVCGVGWAQQWELENGTVRQKGGDGCIAVAVAAAPGREALALERPPPAPPAMSSPPLGACANSSAKLAPAECTAWVSLYDRTGGSIPGDWIHCKTNRLDPCGCRYRWAGTIVGVNSSADGQHILKL